MYIMRRKWRSSEHCLDLSATESELINEPGRELILKGLIAKLLETSKFDYILIDCPPSLGLLTLLHLNMDLTRAKFDQLTADLVNKSIEPMKKAMADAGITNSDLAKVILVGGSTRIPAVQEAVKRVTGKEPFKGINPDECVAIGAAIQAGVLTG